MKPVDLHRSATAEMIEAARFYERRRPGVGFRFLQRIETVCEQIGETPDAGFPLTDDERRRAVPGFPYSLIYKIRNDRVVVLAIMHHRRKPGYWTSRRRR